MTRSHPSRIFASGAANTLYVTIPARLASDSQFPFEADEAVTVSIDGDQLRITADTDGEEK